eukprot:5361088-Pleurochrysis_carterae.AAC.1
MLYLSVPFAEKEAAKNLGARWDPARKKWYVPSHLNNAPFVKWSSNVQLSGPTGSTNSVLHKRCHTSGAIGSCATGSGLQKAQSSGTTHYSEELSLYTDGACVGNAHVASVACPAGWGV